jgi:hypothetical protein
MKVEQARRSTEGVWNRPLGELRDAQLVFVFAGGELSRDGEALSEVGAAYPQAQVIGCSTAGEICASQVTDNTLVATAVRFEDTRIELARVQLDEPTRSREAGHVLATSLPAEGLVHVVVFSEGLQVNGSELVKGITAALPARVSVTGVARWSAGR